MLGPPGSQYLRTPGSKNRNKRSGTIFCGCSPEIMPLKIIPWRGRNMLGEWTRQWALRSGETKTCPTAPSEFPHSKQTSSQFLVQLLLAARSNHCPQIPWCQLQSVQAPQPISKPWRSPPLSQAQVLQLLKKRGALFPNFTKMVQREMAIRGAQPLAVNFSIVRTNRRAWLNVLDPGPNDVMWNDFKSVYDCTFRIETYCNTQKRDQFHHQLIPYSSVLL